MTPSGKPCLPIHTNEFTPMDTLRLGLIGLGNIGRHHAAYLLDGKVLRCELRAVAAPTEARTAPYAARGLATFSNGLELIHSGTVDAVLIATPHPTHVALGVAALESGLHVMVEKPLAAHKADAERLLTAARQRPHLQLAGMFQLRMEPRYARIRSLLQSGELGTLQRINWINTDWFRTEAYYASSGWRATWQGEGGGVLLNQCLHNLDVFCWLMGSPRRVRGFVQLGRWHDIEVEDEATAFLEFDGGASGLFVGSTGESPGTNRLELVGTRGRLVLENQRLTLIRNESDAVEWSKTTASGFTPPPVWNCDLPFENHPAPHAALMQNFVAAILEGAPLIAPGEAGLASVELANAIVYSSLTESTVDLPLNGTAWEGKLAELIAGSTRQKVVRSTGTSDFAASFRR